MGPDTRPEPVWGVVGHGRELVDVVEGGGHYDRPEDLLVHHAHVGPGVGNDCWLEEVAEFSLATAADEDVRSLLTARAQIGAHSG